MPKVIALIPVDSRCSRLGLAPRWRRSVAGRPVWQHTLARLARVTAVEAIVLVHPAGQEAELADLAQAPVGGKPVHLFAGATADADRGWARRTAARKWALTAWRGGLGGALVYDELLPARPLVAALDHFGAESALLAGLDWMLLDSALSQRVLALHLEYPQAMTMTFCQAPPGLAGLALARKPLEQLADHDATLGQGLAYNPMRPQADAIGRDVCVQVSAAVRGSPWRFIDDTPAGGALLEQLAALLGDQLPDADADAVVAAARRLSVAQRRALRRTPRQVTVEITPRRAVTGPIVPQHYVTLDRPDMTLDQARRLWDELAGEPDTVVTLGGLGDALLHPQWLEIVQSARRAGIWGLALDTDLLCDAATVDQLLEAELDVITVRLNADTGAVYEKVMGRDGFKTVLENMTNLFNQRTQRDLQPQAPRWGLPWIVPRLVKTPDTLADMESFFDKWTHFLNHAVIEGATTGLGLMPDLAPLDLAPPGRCACRQIDRRLTVLSDGTVARCDQDWLGKYALTPGAAVAPSLAEAWAQLGELSLLHHERRWDELDGCRQCHQWHRP